MRTLIAACVVVGLIAGCDIDFKPPALPSDPDELGAQHPPFPRLKQGEPCPEAGTISLSGIPGQGALGPYAPDDADLPTLEEGPVYLMLPGIPRILTLTFPDDEPPAASSSASIRVIGKAEYQGRIFVEGRRLDGGGHVKFGADDPSRRLRLPPGSWAEAPQVDRASDSDRWRIAEVATHFPGEGCFGLRVIGRGFGYLLPVVVIGN